MTTRLKAPKIRVDVEKGIIDVNSVTLMRATPDLVWFMLDTTQKYPGVSTYGVSMIALEATDRTLRVTNKSAPLTVVRIHGMRGGWMAMVDTGRYTVSFLAVRSARKNEGRALWWDRRDSPSGEFKLETGNRENRDGKG